ncbi:ferredoxin [Micromonospora sp. WMMD708]|uniref:ferredoxin n=1 Tax=Micromonospora sp. WMMD708 TaxID=3403464 RepID=UPI003BF5813F
MDRVTCIGAGQCVMHAPDVFDQDLDGVVVIRTAAAAGEVWEDVVEAAARCPVQAITLPGA